MREPTRTTIRLKLEALHSLQKTKGLSSRALARRAGINERTLQRINELGYCRLDTARLLAKALGLSDCEPIIDPPISIPPTSQSTLGEASIAACTLSGATAGVAVVHVPVPIHYLKKESVLKLLFALANEIANTGAIDEEDTEVRSIDIAIRFSAAEDIKKLVAAFCEGRLLRYAIAEIKVPIDVDVPAILASIGGETMQSSTITLLPRSKRLTIEVNVPEASPFCDEWRLIALVHSPNPSREQGRQGEQYREAYFQRQWELFVSSAATGDIAIDT